MYPAEILGRMHRLDLALGFPQIHAGLTPPPLPPRVRLLLLRTHVRLNQLYPYEPWNMTLDESRLYASLLFEWAAE